MGSDRPITAPPTAFAAVPGELPLEETSKFIIDSIGYEAVDDLSLALVALENSLEELKVEASGKFPSRAREFHREMRRAKQAFDLLNTGINESSEGNRKSGAG